MRRKTSVAALACAAFTLLLFANCRKPGIEDFAAKLAELPKDLDATLDPKTLATKVSTTYPQPEKEPGTAAAPCCGSTDTKSLKVKFPYTKCGPLRDFIVVKFADLIFVELAPRGAGGQGAAPSGVKAFRRGELNRTSVLDTIVCFTGDGPWNATLIENRHCVGYTPQDSLIINAFGDVISFVWNGGPANHPPAVQLVSCRRVSLTRFPCGGLSDCSCVSDPPCPADQPCDCGLQGQW
jgi:hypothetical protein